MSDSLKVTVFIPVYNGEHDHLEETLTALYMQKTSFKWDVLITDSGSTDRSVEIIEAFAEKHGNLTLRKINKESYSHGRTRQWAAEQSSAEFMVYLTQDAVPANSFLLQEMIEPFRINHKVVAVLGRQQPRVYCFPAMKYDINAVFNEQGVADATTLWSNRDLSLKGHYTKESFYSDVCSAAPRAFLLDEIPYRDVAYSEDYEYGKDIIDAGYIKAYNSKAVVVHSNDVLLSEYRQRIFDETYNVRLNGGHSNPIGIFFMLKQIFRSSFKDSIRILRDKDYVLKQKLYWLIVNPLFHIEKWRGIRQANNVELGSDISKFSLEKSRSKD